MVAGTSQQKLIFWKYQGTGFKSAIKCESSVESLAYCNKAPILIFNGGSDGDINKWERQACLFMYDNHTLPYFEAQGKSKMVLKELETQGRSRHTQMTGENHGGKKVSDAQKLKNDKNSGNIKGPKVMKNKGDKQLNGRTVLRLVYNEENDLLIAACEDFNIYIWGFDEEQTRAAAKIYAMNDNNQTSEPDLLGFHRVSGFICKYVFFGHENIVTSLSLIELGKGQNMLVSTGWDKKMFLWNLDELDFIGGLSENGEFNKCCGNWVNASDAEILDVCYADEVSQIAYASSDTYVYVRKFEVLETEEGRKVFSPLIGVMKHDHEANVVCWLKSRKMWVTASQDETVRFWNCVDDNKQQIEINNAAGETKAIHNCVLEIMCNCPVSVLTVDHQNDVILAALDNNIHIFDAEDGKLLQVKYGHAENIRCILSIPERKQYISGSWDRQVIIWPSIVKPKKEMLNIF